MRLRSASARLARSATMRNLRRGFLTTETARLHLLRASSDGLLCSTAKFFLNAGDEGGLRFHGLMNCFEERFKPYRDWREQGTERVYLCLTCCSYVVAQHVSD
ncbi:hypothetical protein QQP08_004732 [Theobroma cacao]|nr:hypothetical protein QQP08_004732 [Theobroma cacao]